MLVADDGTGLYYEEVGPPQARLTVLFVHGFALQLGSFYFQREALREHFGAEIRMVFYDQRSHGRSDRSESKTATIDQLGHDLDRVIDTLAPDGPLVLVGHSMGGMTVLALAERHPELFTGTQARVSAVALLSTSAGEMGQVTLGLPALLARIKGPLLPLLLRGARRQPSLVERGRVIGNDIAWVLTRRLSFGTDDIPSATVEYLNTMISSTPIDVIADFFPALMAHDKLAALPVLEHLPVQIIVGDHDLLTPPEHSATISAALPEAELIVVPDAGHVALLEHPQVIDDALQRLISGALARTKRRKVRR